MKEKQTRRNKLWQSAYAVRKHPRMGPVAHGAGMVERTTGVTHLWLVRGPCTQSVVRELQHQLAQAYCIRDKADTAPARPGARHADRLLAGLMFAGLVGLAIGTFARR